MKVGLAAALLSAALATCVAKPVSAETLPLSLEWTAPPQCPTAGEVRREVARQAHVAPGRTPPPLDARARVELIGDRWRVELRTTRAGIEGYQTLEDESCELLARATALVLALALYDPGERAPTATPAPEEPRPQPAPRRRPPSSSSDLTKPTPEPPAEDAEPAPAPPASSRRVDVAPSMPPTLAAVHSTTSPPTSVWAVAVDVRASRGPLPEMNFAVALGVDVRRGRWRGRLRLVGGPPTEQASADAPDVRGRYQAWGASAAACVVARPDSRLALAACAQFDATVLVATASGAARDFSTVAPWYAVGPAALARLRVSGRTRLELGAGLGVSIDRPRFALLHLGDVYQVARLVPNVTIGLSVEL